MSALRVALWIDPGTPLEPSVSGPAAVLGYELAQGLAEHCAANEDLAVDLFAGRGSQVELPLVSLDPEELPGGGSLEASGRRLDALFCQLVLSGMTRGYDLVHCLAPVVTPLQLVAAAGTPVLHSPLVAADHPAALLPPRLVAPPLLRRLRFTAAPQSGLVVEWSTAGGRSREAIEEAPVAVTLGVDLVRYRPVAEPRGDFLAWSGAGGGQGRKLATAVAEEVGMELWSPAQGGAEDLLPYARALLHPASEAGGIEALWPLRALACAVPVIAVAGGELDEVFGEESCGALPAWEIAADPTAMAAAVVDVLEALPRPSPEVIQARRRRALGHHNRRAMVARCRELYAAMREAK
ncbi:MAG: hypothetical protein SX243_01025 [Acidobacteriota bacterium]|nr:hypothetical protein [Acidobacteriota bacterium]